MDLEGSLRASYFDAVSLLVDNRPLLGETLSTKPHPYIISLRYAFQDVDHLYLAMDFIGGGDLFSLLEQHSSGLPVHWIPTYSGEVALVGRPPSPPPHTHKKKPGLN